MNRTLALAAFAAFCSMAVVFILKTLADTAFLAEYGTEYLAHFFVAESATLISTSAAYSALIKRGPSLSLDLSVLIALAAAALVAPIVIDSGGAWVFVGSLFLVAVSGLANMAVWNAATEVARGRTQRLFLPRAGAAATAGAVVGGFLASAVVAATSVTWLGPLAAAMLGLLAVVQVVLMRAGRGPANARPRSEQSRMRERAAKRASSGLSRKLIKLIIWAAVFEAVLAAVVDFGFKDAVSSHYDRDQMGVFFSLFYGVTNSILLILQLFVTSRLLAVTPLRFTISLQPVVILISAALWLIFPTLALAVTTRGWEGMMKFGVARPAQEVAMGPLGERARQRAKVLVRGVFAQGGSALAGLLLIVAAPLLVDNKLLIPAVAVVMALGWFVLQMWTSQVYLGTMESALGMRRLSLRSRDEVVLLDRDGLAKAIAMIGSDDGEQARLGRALLQTLPDTSVLAPHLTHDSVKARRTLYQRIAEAPSPSAAAALRDAVLQEAENSDAIADGLTALAAYGDPAAVEVARALATGDPATSEGTARAAWEYLAEVGALTDDAACHEAVRRATLQRDGVRAAAMYRAALDRDELTGDQVDQEVGEVLDRDDAAREGFKVAAMLGRFKPLAQLLKGIEKKRPGAEQALIHIDSTGLARLRMLANSRKVSGKTRERMLRGLRGSDLPEIIDVALLSLSDEDERVRDMAVRTLLQKQRESDERIPTDPVEVALGKALDRFRTYVLARPAYPADLRESSIAFRHDTPDVLDVEVFFLDELERRTEVALTKVCELLAVLGNPSKVFAAAREIRAPKLKQRLKAVDILQEVAPRAQRARLFNLLDRYLQPKPPGDDEVRAVCELDPWLARCKGNELAEIRRRLSGLRAATLFDGVPGDVLVELARSSSEVSFDKGAIIVKQGEPGDALFIVLSGVVVIERDGTELNRLLPGQSFGELALIDGEPRGATVRTATDSRLLRLPRAPFRAALGKYFEIRFGLLRGLSAWLRAGA